MAAPNAEAITIEELKDLMDISSHDVSTKLAKYGGVEGLSQKLRTSLRFGISANKGDIKFRIETFGLNEIKTKATKSFFVFMREALQDTILIMLEVCAVISIALAFIPLDEPKTEIMDQSLHGWVQGLAILLSVAAVVLVTAANDYSKEKQFRDLQQHLESAHLMNVTRGGEIRKIPVRALVVGDICIVNYGDLVPADGILIRSNDISVDESSLTGESVLIKKNVSTNPLLWSGTHIMEGSGKMLVTAVGIHSQCGIILSQMGVPKDNNVQNTTENIDGEKTHERDGAYSDYGRKRQSILQAKLTKLAIQIGYAGITAACLTVVCLIIEFIILHYVTRKEPWQMFHLTEFLQFLIIGVTIMVVAVPQGLPLAVTLSLAYSVRKMMEDHNLVRHLSTCETMGNATTICLDKTGILTTNRMTVVQSYICGKHELVAPTFSDLPNKVGNLFLYSIAINTSYASNIELSEGGKLPTQVGNITECALLGFSNAMGMGYKSIRKENPEESFIRVYPFNSVRKCMSTVIPRKDGGFRLFTKGASEIILNMCTFIYDENGEVEALTRDMKVNIIRDVVKRMAHDGLRTLCIAYRDFVFGKAEANEVFIDKTPNWDDEYNILNKLTCIAIVGIEDPVRPEVPAAIESCMKAGIVVRMVTGDNIDTSRSIALKCGIIKPGDDYLMLEGHEFNVRIRDRNGKIQQVLLDEVWPKLRVLARSSPNDKYNLVKGIIDSKITVQREVVAVTGDGPNDGPVLRRADVGFSMGISGTNVAKEASDIIITDDNFCSIVKAVIWGRNVYESIFKFLQFQVTVNICAVVVVLTSVFAVKSSILTAVQMLWVNLIMDTLACLALATELPTPDILDRKPHGRCKHLISLTMLRNIIGQSVYVISVVFFLLFEGDYMLDIPTGRGVDEPNQHFTVVFNTFVLMTLCNEINARKVHSERNVFKGSLKNPFFYTVWLTFLLLQSVIVKYGEWAFGTSSLTWIQWLVCVLFGVGTLLWNQLIITIPTDKISVSSSGHKVKVPNENLHSPNILRLRGVSRLRSLSESLADYRASITHPFSRTFPANV